MIIRGYNPHFLKVPTLEGVSSRNVTFVQKILCSIHWLTSQFNHFVNGYTLFINEKMGVQIKKQKQRIKGIIERETNICVQRLYCYMQ